ncbi:outer membrane protein assembly factor BamE [Raoultella sp. HC6]|uniref:outer membrane protein assembly factor BamE domain-containing protein n=1 Tax=Raoultella sp. HC6 TaxID=2923366 RepID=UPI001F50E9CE|nr:outer membrane protein assembly factor BamE [Raoultella sp. HC6]
MNKITTLLTLCLTLLISGCIGHIDRTHEGSVQKLSEKELSKNLIPGKTTKRDVLLLLGRPTLPEDYNVKNDWVYHSKTTGKALYVIAPVNYDKEVTLTLKFNDDKTLVSSQYRAN